MGISRGGLYGGAIGGLGVGLSTYALSRRAELKKTPDGVLDASAKARIRIRTAVGGLLGALAGYATGAVTRQAVTLQREGRNWKDAFTWDGITKALGGDLPAGESSSVGLDKKGAAGPDKKNAAKPDKKGAAGPDKKSAAKPDKKDIAGPDNKSAAKPDKKDIAGPDNKSAAKPDKKDVAGPDQKGAAKPDKKGATGPDKKGATGPDKKGAAKPDQKGAAGPDKKNSSGSGPKGSVAPDPGAPSVELSHGSPDLSQAELRKAVVGKDLEEAAPILFSSGTAVIEDVTGVLSRELQAQPEGVARIAYELSVSQLAHLPPIQAGLLGSDGLLRMCREALADFVLFDQHHPGLREAIAKGAASLPTPAEVTAFVESLRSGG